MRLQDKIDPLKRVTPTNRELLAQGTGNIISGLIGGLPLTSVIVRSTANLNAGAQSKLSSIIHGLILLLGVLFFATQLNNIPLASLAAILIATGYKLWLIQLCLKVCSACQNISGYLLSSPWWQLF
ncbi:MAG: SulP family inorganic anion transporter [Saprospiraceae bacterium]|nr:SulP family inorganic anion transporter [Saprospiraceae bacterium]